MRRIFIAAILLCAAGAVKAQSDIYDSLECEYVKVNYDRFNEVTTIATPWNINGDKMKFSFSTDSKSKHYYLFLETTGLTATVYKKGVTVMFDDDTKLSYPAAAVDCEADHTNFSYTAMIDITAQLAIYKKKNITDFKLYIYNEEYISQGRARQLRLALNCMTTKETRKQLEE